MTNRFSSRGGFILACVGAAVGLGDSLRFPGLCAKYGGAFLLIYTAALLLIGIPVLNAEIALGRKFRSGAPKCMKSLKKSGEKWGWAAAFNSLGVAALYAGMLGWIIVMLIKFPKLCKLSTSLTQAQTGRYFFDNVLGGNAVMVFFCIAAAWVLMYMCLKKGADSLSKTARFTVLAPIILLCLMAGRGLIYSNSSRAMYALFVPDFSAFKDAGLWLSAVGQVFFSLSVFAGIMPAYGAYLPDKENIFKDSLIIAFSDYFVSVLSSVVLFTTLYGCGLENDFSSSGIITAFMVYPIALTRLFGAGNTALNSVAGILFYLSLGMMALQSSASMVEAATNPLSEKFALTRKKVIRAVAILGCIACAVFASPLGVAVLDVADHFLNYFNILFIGTAECVYLGLYGKDRNLVGEINLFGGRLKMPKKMYTFSLRYLSPVALGALSVWGIYHLFAIESGIYGGYSIWLQAFGWGLSLSVFVLGGILSLNFKPRSRQRLQLKST